MSDSYISFAKKKYGKRAEFYCEKINPQGLGNIGKFDTVISAGVIHHLNNDEAIGLISTAKNALKKCGTFVALEPCFKEPQSRLVRWLLENDRGEYVRWENEYAALCRKVFPIVFSEIREDLWLIPFTNVVVVARECLSTESQNSGLSTVAQI